MDLHQSGPLRGTLIKSGKPRPRYTRPQRCIWPGCRATLSHDHDSPVCSCHLHGYRLEHDRAGVRLVLHLLLAAYPDAIDLSELLGASPGVVKARVNYLRRRGHHVTGLHHGYAYCRYEPPQIGPQRGTRCRSVRVK
jgi:hypothetical protein